MPIESLQSNYTKSEMAITMEKQLPDKSSMEKLDLYDMAMMEAKNELEKSKKSKSIGPTRQLLHDQPRKTILKQSGPASKTTCSSKKTAKRRVHFADEPTEMKTKHRTDNVKCNLYETHKDIFLEGGSINTNTNGWCASKKTDKSVHFAGEPTEMKTKCRKDNVKCNLYETHKDIFQEESINTKTNGTFAGKRGTFINDITTIKRNAKHASNVKANSTPLFLKDKEMDMDTVIKLGLEKIEADSQDHYAATWKHKQTSSQEKNRATLREKILMMNMMNDLQKRQEDRWMQDRTFMNDLQRRQERTFMMCLFLACVVLFLYIHVHLGPNIILYNS